MSFNRTLIISLVLISGAVSLFFLNHAETVPPKKPFSTFPKEIQGWKGKEGRFDDAVYDILGVEDSILADYKRSDGRSVQLYIGYYQSQRKGDLIHSPKNCMPGAGWKIIRTDYAEVPRENETAAQVIRLTLQNGPQKQIMFYWFHSRGRIIASEYWQKIYLVWDSIVRHRTDGSFVRLISPVVNGDDEKALKNLTEFAQNLFPILNDYIPS